MTIGRSLRFRKLNGLVVRRERSAHWLMLQSAGKQKPEEAAFTGSRRALQDPSGECEA